MHNDRYIVMKLITSEELVAHLVNEDDYQINVLFPMIVRHISRMTSHGPAESIVMAPYTYFAKDDEYTFQKSQIVFIKDLDPKYEAEYNHAIDDFISVSCKNPEPVDAQEMQELTEKLQAMFKDRMFEEEEFPSIQIDSPKVIH
jgi:hypothetical protein